MEGRGVIPQLPHGPNKPPTHAPQRSAAHTNGAIHPSTHPIRDGAKLPVRQGADGRAVAGAGPRPRAEPVRRGCPALKCFTPTSPQLLHRAVCPGSIGSPHDGAMTATDDDGRRALEAIRSGLQFAARAVGWRFFVLLSLFVARAVLCQACKCLRRRRRRRQRRPCPGRSRRQRLARPVLGLHVVGSVHAGAWQKVTTLIKHGRPSDWGRCLFG